MSRTPTLVGYGVLAAALVAGQVIALTGRRIPTFGQAIALVSRWRIGRWLILALWLWIGWHAFVRSDID